MSDNEDRAAAWEAMTNPAKYRANTMLPQNICEHCSKEFPVEGMTVMGEYWYCQGCYDDWKVLFQLLPDYDTTKLDRLLSIIQKVIDRKIETKEGSCLLHLPMLPREMKEIRSAFEPFRPHVRPETNTPIPSQSTPAIQNGREASFFRSQR